MSGVGKQPRGDEKRLDFSIVLTTMMKAKEAMTLAGATSGEMPCPRCATGIVRYGKAPNGHTSGCCSTPSCMSWME